MKELLKRTSLLLMILVAGLGFTACSDDDDEAGIPSDLVGTWVCTSSYEAYYVDGELTDEYTDDDVNSSFTLNANGTMSRGGNTAGTWSANSNTMYVTVTDEDGTWTTTYNMQKLSNDSYTLSYDISYSEDGINFRDVYSMTLQRQNTASGGNDGDDDNTPIDSTENQPEGGISIIDPGYATGVSVNANDIIGNWTVINGYSAYYQNGRLMGSEEYTTDEGLGDVMTINADGTCDVSNGVNGTWRLNGSHLYITTTEDGDTETTDYVVTFNEGNKIELRVDYTVDNPNGEVHGIESITLQRQ